MGHLARVPQDAEQCEQRDDRRREREQHQGGQYVAGGTLGEACADAALDVVSRVGSDEPCDGRDDDGLADHHEGVATRLRVALDHDEVPFAVALPFADQYEPEGCRDGRQQEAGDDRSDIHNVLR